MRKEWMALKQLDQQLGDLQGFSMPKQGWIRTLRKALGMTIKQLAKHLAVDPSRVVKLETSEMDGGVTLKSLRKVADALDCHVVYAFVPRQSLQTTITQRAQQLAKQQVTTVSHSMTLEQQGVSTHWQHEQIETLQHELLNKPWKHLW
tara:strand:+ start:51368 stop:51811 length:444 start_codon:yes stop_codon:yes gene_type:complete